MCVCLCVFICIHTNNNIQGHVNELSRPLVNLARLCPVPPPKLKKSPADQAQATASDAATSGAADGGVISNASVNATNLPGSNTTRLGRLFASKGMIGCYLSHKVFWERTLASDRDWSIVLEDDGPSENHRFVVLVGWASS